MHFLCTRKLVKSSGEAEIKIFEVLSKYIKDPLQAKTFVEILLPFLEKGVKDSGKITIIQKK